MAKTFSMVKHLQSLRPIDEEGEEAISRVGQGEIVEVAIRKPRNGAFHRYFWALANLCWKQIDHDEFPTPEKLVNAMKVGVGCYEDQLFILEDGQKVWMRTPGSISYAAMDAVEFAEFFERCCDWIAKYVVPGITADEWRQEIEAMAGIGVHA